MRYAFVIEELSVGGAEQMLVAMANAFADRGAEVHVVCLSRAGELADRLHEPVQVHVLDKRPGVDVRLVWRLRRLLVSLAPDAVNAHLWVANLWTRVASVGTGLRIIVTEHSRDTWKSGLYRRIDRLLVPMTAALVAVSEDTAAFYRDQVGVPASRVRVINNGIDVARYAEGDGRTLRTEWAGEDEVLVGTVGRLIPAKNQQRFIAAIALLVSRGVAVRAVIVGEGPERSALQAAIASAKVQGRVTLVGARSDVPDVLAAFDVFVLSSDREGHPLTALEAQAAGTPVVLTAAGGSADAIARGAAPARHAMEVTMGGPNEERVGGLLVACDTDALAAAIEVLITDPVRRAAMGRFAQRHARAHFDLATMVDRYEALMSVSTP